eukprot:scaffold38967_cov54-Attheya_sp.AAC.3
MYNTSTLYIYSRPIGLRIEFDGYEGATFDPSSVSNRCWDQKIARVAACNVRELLACYSSRSMRRKATAKIVSRVPISGLLFLSLGLCPRWTIPVAPQGRCHYNVCDDGQMLRLHRKEGGLRAPARTGTECYA